MTLSTSIQLKQDRPPRRFDIAPPAWVREWTGADDRPGTVDGLTLTIARGTRASLVAVAVPGAAALAADEFEQCTRQAYHAIRSTLATLPHPSPVRFWNYLPAIHEPMDERRDRYMVFNAGRFEAMSDWFGGIHQSPGLLPAASGVGHRGDELVVHCLACQQSGQSVENPRQIPAFQYSRRYGPLPPCFSRATIVADPFNNGRALIVSGTASILGEQTVHAGDLRRQLEETLANLRVLLDTVPAPCGGFDGFDRPLPIKSASPVEERWTFSDVRAYHPRRRDAALVGRLVSQALGPGAKVQLVHAELCRGDLLVEIEGLATQNAGGGCE